MPTTIVSDLNPASLPEVLSLEQAAAVLSIAPKTLWRWRRRARRPFPAVKPSAGRRGAVYVLRSALLEWLAACGEQQAGPPPRKSRSAKAAPAQVV